jgi:hypothetical protein
MRSLSWFCTRGAMSPLPFLSVFCLIQTLPPPNSLLNHGLEAEDSFGGWLIMGVVDTTSGVRTVNEKAIPSTQARA